MRANQYAPPLRMRDGNASPRTQLRYSHSPRSVALQPAIPPIQIRPHAEWQNQVELTLLISNLDPSTTTYDLYRNFHVHGTVVFIEIFEGRDGKRGGGKVRFSPPPAPFWNNSFPITAEDGSTTCNVFLSVDKRRNSDGKFQSPIKPNVFYDTKMKLNASSLQFGVMVYPDTYMPMYSLTAINMEDISFTMNLPKGKIEAHFTVRFTDPRIQGDTGYQSSTEIGKYNRTNLYMFSIPFGQLKVIEQVKDENDDLVLLISLDSPPRFFRKRDDQKASHQVGGLVWNEQDTWYRQTDMVYDPYPLEKVPISLCKEQPVIDIGRWTTYRFVFSQTRNNPQVFSQMKKALQDFNIEVVPLPELKYSVAHKAELWSLVGTRGEAADLRSLGKDLATVQLPFEVRYQLEVCISREIINEYNIDKNFLNALEKLASADPSKAQNILEYVAENYTRLYHPMTIFDNQEALAFSSMTDIPHYCAFSRKATVTPTTIYFSSPSVETTNRVLRHYSKENGEGRFLRVQFTDEKFEGRINACADKAHNDELFTRVFRTIRNGIRIGDRHYEFLAFGNSQFRENGAYFFYPTSYLSCDDIRRWMGTFSHINVVAKYAARLGQCFSTTRAINGLSAPDLIKIPDIERNGFTFTDGVGKISPFLAQMIAAELKLRAAITPSAFQFRLGGCKGVLVVSPDAKGKEVHIRKSQQKFQAVYNGLEIIRCSQFMTAALNRQTITILSALGVEDEVFLDMLSEQLSNYQNAMSDNTLALSLLNRYIDDNHMTINIAGMILSGFMTEREPFVLSLLHLWRSWSIKLLKEKAKIIVENGAFVLGCVDETDTLRGYTKPTVARGMTYKEEELPQIFIQVPDKENPTQYNVIEGICLVGRNPSLHPGDLRVVQAVDVPALHHLRDVVVFPQSGEKDIPSMCSGGDLDGDDYFVIWDKKLQPKEWNCEPMHYNAPEPVQLNRPVVVLDLMMFFVRYMKNDSLPTIAHAHLASADYLIRGVKDPKCLELAELHSKAVDYVKTGQPAQMPKRLRVAKWPHFMEKRFKPKAATYHSEKILGRLYDRVESVDFVPQYDAPFDKRILRAYQLESSVLKAARQTKSKYDTAMRRIMAQQEIKTEFEVWSTFVLSKPRVGSDYKLQEEMALITGAFKDRFRQECIDRAGGKEFSVLGPFVAAMYKVTKEETDIALAECRATKVVHGITVPKRKMRPESMPLISFPWLFEKELSRIATGIEAMDEFEERGFETADINKPHAQGSKRHIGMSSLPEDDVIKQENGVIIHRGEVLDLFQDSASDGGIDDESEDVRSPADLSESMQDLVDVHLAANLAALRCSPPPLNASPSNPVSNHTADNSKEGAAPLLLETKISMPSVPDTEPGSEVDTDDEQIVEIVEEEDFETPAINKLSCLLDL
ncbi:hypothetical protein CJF31_00010029 [Rutstroemia sp. NJR-2017a BVV2]|nr:hypothetical protein CJF31_00010029 [Rutstroemia sp. NJR-2017a BVV2]